MSDDFGNDFVTISDEDGNDFVLEHIDTLELDDEFYMALLPTDMDEDDEDFGLVILKVITEGDEELLTTIDDEELLDYVYGMFMERFMDEEPESFTDGETDSLMADVTRGMSDKSEKS